MFYFADADPSGWQMGVLVSRKLQALSELLGPFGFEVHRVALTPDQVRGLGLPSTPLKATEKRAGKWMARTGREQTEIDAAIALRPAELGQIARDALGPFFDTTLASRFGQARQDWEDEAQEIIDAGMEPPEALVSQFVAAYMESERLHLEFLIAQDDLMEMEKP